MLLELKFGSNIRRGLRNHGPAGKQKKDFSRYRSSIDRLVFDYSFYRLDVFFYWSSSAFSKDYLNDRLVEIESEADRISQEIDNTRRDYVSSRIYEESLGAMSVVREGCSSRIEGF